MRFMLPAAIVAALFAGPAWSGTAVLDFESFSDADRIDQSPLSLCSTSATVSISAFRTTSASQPNFSVGNALIAVALDTQSNTNDPDLREPFDGDESTQSVCPTGNAGECGFGKIAVVQSNGAPLTSGANDNANTLPLIMRFVFDTAIEFISLDALDFGDTGSNSPNLRVFLDGAQVTGSPDGISGNNLASSFNATNTLSGKTLDVFFGSSGGIDNIKVNIVPLPAGAWLLLSGFGLVAGTLRWRKRAA